MSSGYIRLPVEGGGGGGAVDSVNGQTGVVNLDTADIPESGATNRYYTPTRESAKQDTITGAASTVTSANLTTNKALVSDASGKIATVSVTSTELNYLGGVTSAIQSQLNSKAEKNTTYYQPLIVYYASGSLYYDPQSYCNTNAVQFFNSFITRAAKVYDGGAVFVGDVPAFTVQASWEQYIIDNFFIPTGQTYLLIFFYDVMDESIQIPSRVGTYSQSVLDIFSTPFDAAYQVGLGCFGFFQDFWGVGSKNITMPPKANQREPITAPQKIQNIWNQLLGGYSADFINNDIGQIVWKRPYPYNRKDKKVFLPNLGSTKYYDALYDRKVIDPLGNVISPTNNSYVVIANGFFDVDGNSILKPSYLGQKLVFVCLLQNGANEQALEISGVVVDKLNMSIFDYANYDIEMVVESPNGYVKIIPLTYSLLGNTFHFAQIDFTTLQPLPTKKAFVKNAKLYFRLKSKTTEKVSKPFPIVGTCKELLRFKICTFESNIKR
jgi:hypothetical protein